LQSLVLSDSAFKSPGFTSLAHTKLKLPTYRTHAKWDFTISTGQACHNHHWTYVLGRPMISCSQSSSKKRIGPSVHGFACCEMGFIAPQNRSNRLSYSTIFHFAASGHSTLMASIKTAAQNNQAFSSWHAGSCIIQCLYVCASC
jgi:hypothetical protein